MKKNVEGMEENRVMRKQRKKIYARYIKRSFDMILCICTLPFFLILYVIVGAAIKLDDGGPVFYKAERIGKDETLLRMYKFRSMKVDAPNILNADGSTFNSANDERVTRVGKFIRKTSIDEIPQILNVLKGEMSIIGPRASGYDALPTYKDDEKAKMKVVPGITGYTQAYFRNSLTVREKRLRDAWYAEHISFLLDIRIFFKTVQTVLKRENIYTNK